MRNNFEREEQVLNRGGVTINAARECRTSGKDNAVQRRKHIIKYCLYAAQVFCPQLAALLRFALNSRTSDGSKPRILDLKEGKAMIKVSKA